jgi:CO/xanthine dehydrogenase Mo-binding subunit
VTSVVGTSTPRLDGLTKARGEAIYGVDVALPGMLWAGVLGSPVAAGTITRCDTSAAQQIPGVWAVITAETPPGTVTASSSPTSASSPPTM